MRIAILGPTYPIRGGIAHHTTLLAAQLARRHQVTLVSIAGGYPRLLFPGRTDRDPSREAVTVANEPMLAGVYPWTWIRTGLRIRDARCDLLLVPWWTPYWAPSFVTAIRVAVRGRSPQRPRVIFICHNVWPHDRVSRLDRFLTRAALARADGFLTHSGADAALLEQLAPGKPVEVSLLPSLAVTKAMPRSEARSRLGLPDAAAVILFMGFVRPYKGLAVLLRALPAVVREVPAVRLVVAGEAWGRSNDTMATAATLGVAPHLVVDDRYIPNEELGAYLGAADVMALPYMEATQSGIVTLAAEAGLPVVASKVGGLTESVVDGVTGLLVPAADERALAGALIRVLGDPVLLARLRAGTLAERGRFAWDPVVDRIEALARRAGPAGLQSNRP